MFKKATKMTFGVRIDTLTGLYYIRCAINEASREEEAREHLNRVGELVATFETGFYVFTFKPKFGGLLWDYEWARLEQEPIL